MKIDIRWLLLIVILFVASILFLQFKCYNSLSEPQKPIRILTDNVLCGIFPYEYEGTKGTAFLIHVDGKRYIVASKSVFGKIPQGSKAQMAVRQSGKSFQADFTVVGHGAKGVDLTVLASDSNQLPSGYAVEVNLGDGVFPGMDAYCVGFPCGGYAYGPEVGAVPWVKKATMSSFHNFNNVQTMLLDGMSNPGYSGCPVLVYDYVQEKPVVVAVVETSAFAKMPLHTSKEPFAVPGHDFTQDAVSTTQYTETSGGFFSAVAIKYAVDICKGNQAKNPRIN